MSNLNHFYLKNAGDIAIRPVVLTISVVGFIKSFSYLRYFR